MTKEEAIAIIKDAGYGFLATTEGSQPRVRPMLPCLTPDGKLLLAVANTARTIPQVKENPLVEFCFLDKRMAFCRINGKATITEDIEKKQLLFDNLPELKQYFAGPEDKSYSLLEITPTYVEASVPQQGGPKEVSLR